MATPSPWLDARQSSGYRQAQMQQPGVALAQAIAPEAQQPIDSSNWINPPGAEEQAPHEVIEAAPDTTRAMVEAVDDPMAEMMGPTMAPPPDPFDVDNYNYYRQHEFAMHDLLGSTQFLVRAGVVAPIGNSFLADHMLTGWGMDLAFRRPLFFPSPRQMWFGEIGLNYMQNGGKGPAETTPGIFTNTTNGYKVALDDFYDSRLRDLRRIGLTIGVGWAYRPWMFNRTPRRSFTLNTRVGFKWIHLRSVFLQSPSDQLENIINQQLALGSQYSAFRFDGRIQSGTSYVGMYASGGFAYVWNYPQIGVWHPRQVTLGGDLIFNQEWLNLRRYTPNGNGVATLMPAVTLTIAH